LSSDEFAGELRRWQEEYAKPPDPNAIPASKAERARRIMEAVRANPEILQVSQSETH
jgi:hypothetical protein